MIKNLVPAELVYANSDIYCMMFHFYTSAKYLSCEWFNGDTGTTFLFDKLYTNSCL